MSHNINKHIEAGVARTVSEDKEEWGIGRKEGRIRKRIRDIRTASAIFTQFHTELCSMSSGKNLERWL